MVKCSMVRRHKKRTIGDRRNQVVMHGHLPAIARILAFELYAVRGDGRRELRLARGTLARDSQPSDQRPLFQIPLPDAGCHGQSKARVPRAKQGQGATGKARLARAGCGSYDECTGKLRFARGTQRWQAGASLRPWHPVWQHPAWKCGSDHGQTSFSPWHPIWKSAWESGQKVCVWEPGSWINNTWFFRTK